MLIAQPDQMIVTQKSQRYTTFILAFALYFIAAIYCIYIARQPESIASAWYSNAIIIMILQILAYRDWPIVMVLAGGANLAANLVLGDSLPMSLSFIPNNLLEIGLSAYLLRRFIPLRQCIQDPVLLLKAFGLILIPIGLSALLGGLVLSNYGLVTLNEGWTSFAIGTLIGNVSILPIGLLLLTYGWTGFIKANQAFGFLMSILLALAVALISFAYLPFPFIYISASLIIVALVGGFGATAIGVLAYSIIIGTFTTIGFFHDSLQDIQHDNDMFIYLPLVISLLQPLILAAAIERNRSSKSNHIKA